MDSVNCIYDDVCLIIEGLWVCMADGISRWASCTSSDWPRVSDVLVEQPWHCYLGIIVFFILFFCKKNTTRSLKPRAMPLLVHPKPPHCRL